MDLEHFVRGSRRLFVLTGAGVSTASGIPDYRDKAGDWKRAQPMTLQAFTGSEAARRRYWARSLVGWPVISAAAPNATHAAVARLQADGPVHYLVTQNVDGLHQKAGSPQVQDLHGRLDVVICLGCKLRANRHEFQKRMEAANPAWATRRAEVAPDGDADLDETDFSGFYVPPCEACGGMLKPDVVYFGESVPMARVTETREALAQADAVLVLGSSLMVFSGFRFVREASQAGLPIASVTTGKGRADDMLSLKVEAPCDEALAFALR